MLLSFCYHPANRKNHSFFTVFVLTAFLLIHCSCSFFFLSRFTYFPSFFLPE
ncbi:hypothetical protein L208DRAFT_752863 [Tricholoma matsutake]|nr:hypothetical protein L208DRAFT_752863 [Tricholoma matsutake 945]